MEKPPSRFALVAVAIAGLLIAYPLSAGPVAFIFGFFDWGSMNNPIAEGLELFYTPLFDLPNPLGDWVIGWWNLGFRLGDP